MWRCYPINLMRSCILFIVTGCCISCVFSDKRHLYEDIIIPPMTMVQGFDEDTISLQDLIVPKLVLYYGANECSSCIIRSLADKTQLVEDLSSEVMVIFLLAPSSLGIGNIKHSLALYNLPFPVFIDESGSFPSINPIVNKGRNYHCLLLNQKNQLLFWGNPNTVLSNISIIKHRLNNTSDALKAASKLANN